MTYHITQVKNESQVSVALTNPAPATEPGWQDSRLILPGDYTPTRPPMINHYTDPFQPGENIYVKVAGKALNIYTQLDNWCFFDNGDDTLLGVRQSSPSQTINLYKGKAANLVMTIDPNGTPNFGLSS